MDRIPDDGESRGLLRGLQGAATELGADAGTKGFRVDDVDDRDQSRGKRTLIGNLSSNRAPHDVAEILDVNERLKRKLDSVEKEIVRQARELKSYKNQALTDPLTGLHNRRAFDDVLERRTGERASRKTPVSLLVLDVDHFKNFNDRFGHAAGDVVLKRVAQILADEIRESATTGRAGGMRKAPKRGRSLNVFDPNGGLTTKPRVSGTAQLWSATLGTRRTNQIR